MTTKPLTYWSSFGLMAYRSWLMAYGTWHSSIGHEPSAISLDSPNDLDDTKDLQNEHLGR